MNVKLSNWLLSCCILMIVACNSTDEKAKTASNPSESAPANLPEQTEIEKINDHLSKAVLKPDEFIREEGYLKDGEKHGYWFKFYNRRNKIQRIEHYLEGMLDGTQREYSMNGRLTLEANYKNNILEGLYTEYRFGKRIKECFYVDGKKNGIERIYFKDRDNLGKLQQLIHWKMGKMDGVMEYYNPEGEVVLSYTYKDNERIDD